MFVKCFQGTRWMIHMETMMKSDMSYLKVKQLNQRYVLLVQGIKLMKRTSEIVKWITNLHANEGKPMTKSVVLVLCRLIELLEGFYLTMQRHSTSLVHCIYLVSQYIAHQALTIIAATKVRLFLNYRNMLILFKHFFLERNCARQSLQ